MRFGIPLLADRVAPRCTFADSVVVVEVKGRRVLEQSVVPLHGKTWADLAEALTDQKVDTLVCGGIAPATRESIRGRDVEVIDNVAGTFVEILEALCNGQIREGFGFGEEAFAKTNERSAREIHAAIEGSDRTATSASGNGPQDCIACTNRICLQGQPCPHVAIPNPNPVEENTLRILESAWDVALEKERTLCRLAEVVYFALEMGCQRVGVAFCEDLREPAAILTDVLRRFFTVFPVGCRVGSALLPDRLGKQPPMQKKGPAEKDLCDPLGVAEVLNQNRTDLNILVGFCVGADSVFTQSSEAPVTTIFVKDKSLANNPIGAVYSHYHLEDI
jgi:uncharacterized metal-binding protein/predicted Fe-Mo cluster-binding NifX family protein